MAKDDGIPIRSNKSSKRTDDGVPIRSKKSNSQTYLTFGIAIALASLAIFCACGGIVFTQPNPVRMAPAVLRGEDAVGDLVEHFKKCGLDGEFHPNWASSIGEVQQHDGRLLPQWQDRHQNQKWRREGAGGLQQILDL